VLRQWLKDLYQDNKLIRNELQLGGRKVEACEKLGRATRVVQALDFRRIQVAAGAVRLRA
jgi:hypothetical protein